MKFLVTSIRRHTIDETTAGAFAIHDCKSNNNVYLHDKLFPKPFCARNPNPRGGSRGYKGVIKWQNNYVIANNDCLIFYDIDNFTIKKIITHPSFSGLHHLAVDMNNQLIVSSTASDMYMKICPNTYDIIEIIRPLEDPIISLVVNPYLELRGRKRYKYDPTFDYREEWKEPVYHINYVQPLSDGRLIGYFNSMNLLVQLEPKFKILWAPPLEQKLIVDMPLDYKGLNCPHDILELDNKLYLNSSRGQKLMTFDLKSGSLDEVYQFNHSYTWLRGLAHVNNKLYIGTGIGSIIEFDLLKNKPVRDIQIFPNKDQGNNNDYSVFGILPIGD